MARCEALRGELVRARARTDELFRIIDPEAIYDRPIAERHRLIFYLGHFDAFDWNLLARRSMNATAFNAGFDSLFERGIDPLPGQAPADTPADWPRREEVERYRASAREWIDKHLDEIDPRVLQMAIEHRQMHAETFAYLMHNLPHHRKRGPAGSVRSPGNTAEERMVRIEGGESTLGSPADDFGWDNEHLAHTVYVPAFNITKTKITNAAYLEFVREGGPVPNFWFAAGDDFMFRGMFESYPLPLDHPVWVTWQQANAFSQWKGMSLPTEAQYQRAAAMTNSDPVRDNFDGHHWDTAPADTVDSPNDRPVQMIGNGWEWTSDKFAPFEGFEAHPFYPGYSADFFDGEHYVMKGASPRTAALLTRPGFRNWFRPEYPYMYAGFRLLRND